MTQTEFARTHGLSVATLRNWSRTAAQAAGSSDSNTTAFREIDLAQVLGANGSVADQSWEAEIRLPSGITLALAPGVPLSRVIELVEAVRC